MEHAHNDDSAPACRAEDFDYELPPASIAQTPAAERDAARLMVLDRSGAGPRHATVRDLPTYLRAGDLLVFNDTRVRPARIRGQALRGPVELLVVSEEAPGIWQCLGKPAKRLREGAALEFPGEVKACVGARLEAGRYRIEFSGRLSVVQLLARYGEVPLPPYIRRPGGIGIGSADAERYQTIFADREGAVAAPTAGLHFTAELLDALRRRQIELAWLTLQVGPGTFLPVRNDDVRTHVMEPERAHIPAGTAEAVRRARAEGRRVIAVGTTTTRTLESAAHCWGEVREGDLAADLFILPGFRFQVVDALFTNFHLPRSTLLMLISAFAGRQRVLDSYAVAVQSGYRFYSYGDAMLIL